MRGVHDRILQKAKRAFSSNGLSFLSFVTFVPFCSMFSPAGWAEMEQKETKGTKKAALWTEQEALGRQKKYMCCRHTSREDFQQNARLKIFVSHPLAQIFYFGIALP